MLLLLQLLLLHVRAVILSTTPACLSSLQAPAGSPPDVWSQLLAALQGSTAQQQ